jgi:Obg family GTPase CgtA-like protein
VTGAGLDELRERVDALAAEAAAAEPERTTHVVLRPGRPRFTVTRDGAGTWHVQGRNVERWVLQIDPEDEGELAALQRNLRREGVFRSLASAGASEGDDVEIRGRVFTYVPDASEPVEDR